jgi:outer membrane lipoprotein SlyB
MKTMIKKCGALAMIVASASLMSGCARQIASNVYKESHVGEASRALKGVVVSMRVVRVDSSEKLEENGMGLLGGGVAGGLIGSTVGKGGGKTAATALGAILGAVGGTLAERELNTQDAIEYVIKLSDGTMTSVVQAPEPALAVGQNVLVMISTKGRSRVVADMTVNIAVPVTEKAPQMVKMY